MHYIEVIVLQAWCMEKEGDTVVVVVGELLCVFRMLIILTFNYQNFLCDFHVSTYLFSHLSIVVLLMEIWITL